MEEGENGNGKGRGSDGGTSWLQGKTGILVPPIQALSETDAASLACIYLDVNGLHGINNIQGYRAGDTMLKTVAAILLESFSPTEVYRIGGDEFVVLCKDIARQTVQRGLEEVCRGVGLAGYSISVGLEWREAGRILKVYPFHTVHRQ